MRNVLSLIFIFLSFNLNASIQVNGHFEASKSCPAYLSKNQKSNPDQLSTQAHQGYQLREINRMAPDWLRIEIPTQEQPALRWVHASCGTFDYQPLGKQDCDVTAGKADSYVLALSWQPAFCETHGNEAGKPECLNLSESSYGSQHPTLHGLWPNQNACGTHYGFCGVSPKKSHCAYPALELSDTVSKRLKKRMPSYAYGSCLERHEWNKHGSCQLLNKDDYFSMALRLTKEADHSSLGLFLREHLGQKISQEDLRESLRNAFGQTAAEKVFLGCRNGMLVDIYIQLPALMSEDDSLRDLIEKAPSVKNKNGCPKQFKISNFHI